MAALFRMEVVDLEPQQQIRVMFGYAGGLEPGAPVKLAGVRVGEVDAIDILKLPGQPTRVEVRAKLRKDIQIESDAEFRIGAHGLLGTKFLNIIPGGGGEAPLEGTGVYEGFDPVMMDRVVVTGERIVQKMERAVDGVNRMIGDEEFRGKIQDNVENLSRMIEEVRMTAASLNAILNRVRSGQGFLGKMMTDEEMYQDLKDFVADIKRNPWKLLKKR